MRLRAVPLLLLAWTLIPLSCADDDKPTTPDPATPFPYAKPAVSTMQVDTSDLAGEGAIDKSGPCHLQTRNLALWVDAVLIFPFSIPVGAFGACLLRDPIYLGNATWRWTATGGTGSQEHTDELTARLLGESQVEWALQVSGTQHDLDRFLWISGVSDTAAREGEWRFYDRQSPQTPREVLRISWSVDDALGGSAELLIDVTDGDGARFGDRLRFEASAVQAVLSLEDLAGGETDTTSVRWNRVTGDGRMVSAAGDTCCWGERPGYGNIDCP